MVSCSGIAFSRANYTMHDFLTEHGFDMLLSEFSPPLQSALYDVDRFQALLLINKKMPPIRGQTKLKIE